MDSSYNLQDRSDICHYLVIINTLESYPNINERELPFLCLGMRETFSVLVIKLIKPHCLSVCLFLVILSLSFYSCKVTGKRTSLENIFMSVYIMLTFFIFNALCHLVGRQNCFSLLVYLLFVLKRQ